MKTIMSIKFCCTLFGLLLSSLSYAGLAIGFQQWQLNDPSGSRHLTVAVWYPTDNQQPLHKVADNPAFFGVEVISNAIAQAGSHPLVLLSHGYGGNWGNQSWLAAALVGQGYIVAAPNHPGTSSRDLDSAASAQLWQRPRDISRALDAVLAHRPWLGLIDERHIAVIGHSLGGWTAMELAGARTEPARLESDCQQQAALASCKVYARMQAGQAATDRQALAQNWRDPRIKAAVSLDLGLSRGFSPESLAAVSIPVLVISAGSPNPELPTALESHQLAWQLPVAHTRYVEIADATHFSMLQRCKPGAAALLTANNPDDANICTDGGSRERVAIHQQLSRLISDFLQQVWN